MLLGQILPPDLEICARKIASIGLPDAVLTMLFPLGVDLGLSGFYSASRPSGQQLFGALAQLGERNTGSVEVSGSIPLGSTKNTY